MYAMAKAPKDTNKNTEWCTYPGVWATYILILFSTWLVVLSLSGCSAGHAWTFVNLSHFLITFNWFHWKKGTPFADEDQGMYNQLTWWEQIDNGMQCTSSRKFFTIVPVILYFIACYTTNYENPMFILNTIAMVVLVVAKCPNMHKVRIFGINSDQ
ncbi:ORM1-like protein 1 [Impatiens glandulifera]|uniref:ORM1-like protein 1 n=1 Tax=Impatiens glandulifera TaxID=253017 RepID=UPI001FB0C9E4|nr:ORM1-like protein 1 [Impatiens glandulifera]